MITSIAKFSKSIILKVFVGIIILPFVFWGMGSVFRGGSQNIIVKIDNEKISTQEFANYVNRLNLEPTDRKNIGSTDLLEKGHPHTACAIKSTNMNTINLMLIYYYIMVICQPAKTVRFVW